MEDAIKDFANATDAPELGLAGFSGWARLIDVHDGDTVTVVVKYLGVTFKVNARLLGINTPELFGESRPAGMVSRDALLEHLTGITEKGMKGAKIKRALADEIFLVWLKCGKKDKYGRTLCEVYNGRDAAVGNLASAQDFLLRGGYAVPYMV